MFPFPGCRGHRVFPRARGQTKGFLMAVSNPLPPQAGTRHKTGKTGSYASHEEGRELWWAILLPQFLLEQTRGQTGQNQGNASALSDKNNNNEARLKCSRRVECGEPSCGDSSRQTRGRVHKRGGVGGVECSYRWALGRN